MGSEVSSVRRGTVSVMRGINERVPGQGLPGKFTKSVEILTVCDLLVVVYVRGCFTADMKCHYSSCMCTM
jgi:hypothetical protein